MKSAQQVLLKYSLRLTRPNAHKEVDPLTEKATQQLLEDVLEIVDTKPEGLWAQDAYFKGQSNLRAELRTKLKQYFLGGSHD